MDYKRRDISTVKDVTSESGIVATLVFHPEFSFFSEELTPHHFTDEANGYMYYAISELAKKNVERIDAYNILNILNAKTSTKAVTEKILTVDTINGFLDTAEYIARSSEEEYRLLVNNVLNTAFRRDTYKKLVECENMCFEDNLTNIEEKIYSSLDEVMMQFSTTNEIPQYKDVIDELWDQVVSRQNSGVSGIPMMFPSLKDYVTLEPGELVIVGASAKTGKSALMLGQAVDLLKRDLSVLYIDSELNSRLFTTRLISHLTKIEFARVRSGRYSEEEADVIKTAIEWMKTRKFTHIYMPIFDGKAIYTAAKRMKHSSDGLDAIIVDYFKSTGDGDAFNTYSELGRLTDLTKNSICGQMSVIGLGAAQATESGKLADSAKIGRNASTIIMLQNKTQEEIEADGIPEANRKLRVVLNRNGPQMSEKEYIDIHFDGNTMTYTETRQHEEQTPY